MKALLLTAIFALAPTAHADWQRLQGAGMSYWLYTPAGGATSLMVNLHGCGQHADDLKQLGNWEGAAEKNHMMVAIPDVPNGGVVLGCWNYYGRNHTETNNDNGPLISLTESLLRDHHIDHAFVSGLSSGATEAMVVGCLRPDLFAGVALNSGPALGSDMGEISSPRTTAAQAAQYCLQLAGSRAEYFRTQKAALIRSDQDFLVNIQHSNINAEAFARVYGATSQRSLDLGTLPGVSNGGSGTLYSGADGHDCVAFLINQGLSHNWAAGNARGGMPKNYVNPNSVDFPDFLGTFFASNAQQ